jgi:hypothetical protein
VLLHEVRPGSVPIIAIEQAASAKCGEEGVYVSRNKFDIHAAALADLGSDAFLRTAARQEFQDLRPSGVEPEHLSSVKVQDGSAVRIGHRSEILR